LNIPAMTVFGFENILGIRLLEKQKIIGQGTPQRKTEKLGWEIAGFIDGFFG
jgi:hypothetical protein